MAYFANGTEGEVLDDQCARCPYGEEPCPIALAHHIHNYDACNNEIARAILSLLVNDDTKDCEMLKLIEMKEK